MRIGRMVSALAAVAALTAGPVVGIPGKAAAASGSACAWRLVAAPAPDGGLFDSGPVSATSKDNAWFPDSSLSFSSGIQPWVMRWNGSAVTKAAQVPPLFGQEMYVTGASFDSADDGWIIPDFLNGFARVAEHWNGGHWTMTPIALSPDPQTVGVRPEAVAALSPGNAWAVGMSYRAGKGVVIGAEPIGALTEHWDGNQWQIVPNPAASQDGTYLSAVTALSATDIWAVGRQSDSDGNPVPFAEHWDGSHWSVVPAATGNAPAALYAVSATSDNDIWAVGAQTQQGTSNIAVPLVEHWDGTTWKEVTGLPDVGNARIDRVFAASPTDVWATVEVPSGVNDFLHWDGTSWTTVRVPGPQGAGLRYFYTGLDGTGPGDVWASGLVVNPTLGVIPQVAHLSCGGQ